MLDDFHGKTERPSINFTGGELENAAGTGVGLQITKVAASVAAKLQKQLKGSPSPMLNHGNPVGSLDEVSSCGYISNEPVAAFFPAVREAVTPL